MTSLAHRRSHRCFFPQLTGDEEREETLLAGTSFVKFRAWSGKFVCAVGRRCGNEIGKQSYEQECQSRQKTTRRCNRYSDQCRKEHNSGGAPSREYSKNTEALMILHRQMIRLSSNKTCKRGPKRVAHPLRVLVYKRLFFEDETDIGYPLWKIVRM